MDPLFICFGSKGLAYDTTGPGGQPPTTASGRNLVDGCLNRNERSVRGTVATIEVAWIGSSPI